MALNYSFLTLADYSISAARTDRFKEETEFNQLHLLKYGFFGEVGGLLAAVKKSKRDVFVQSLSDSAQEELGDALWYLNALASRADLTLEAVGTSTIVELRRHLKIGDTERTEHPTTFDHIDGLLAFQNEQIPEPKDVLLYRLAANTGNLFIEYDNSTKNLASPAALDQLAQLFAGLAMVAAKFGLKLSAIAHANLQKIESRWPSNRKYLPFFDEKSKKHEQLPREFSIQFIEREVGGKKFVIQQLWGVNIGDPLTDNRLNGDDYRFHDVFHLAYIAHLGWSPVIRGLLKVKRKSESKVDENEDGARAMIIEEGIATWIFNHARSRDFFEGIKEGKLEYGCSRLPKTDPQFSTKFDPPFCCVDYTVSVDKSSFGGTDSPFFIDFRDPVLRVASL